jgi:hypothetical protein
MFQHHRVLRLLWFVAVIGVVVYPMARAYSGSNADLVERGRYLVDTGGCHDCHTPKIFTPDGRMTLNTELLLSGHPADAALPTYDAAWVKPGQWVIMTQDLTAYVGPWGVTYAANLTSDEQTGIGLWKKEHFIGAMRSGKHMGEGRPIMPPMPWEGIANYTDEDLGAIFAYLQSTQPVKNAVPAPQLAPPPPGH